MSANPAAGAEPASDLEARVEAERAGQPFLLYRDGGGKQRIFFLEPGLSQASVGRQPTSDLVVDWDDHVSRLHARLERIGANWAVVDDGFSRNGTFVNGQRVSGRRGLADGDTLRFGTTTMTFRSPGVDRQATPPVEPAGPAVEPAGAAAGADIPAVDLSTSQRRVLTALCRPYNESRFASPATNQQIADELFLSVGVVKTHLQVLFAKFGVEDLPADEKRVRLVERAFQAGVISERDF